MDLKTFYNLLADTMKSSATILFLIAASSIMAYVMARTKIPGAISDMIMGVSDNRYVILLIMNVFLLVMGMFLDLTPAVLIFVPIFLPIARSIGMSDVHFGLMLIMNLGIGSVTPPVGSCLFVGCGIAKVKIEGDRGRHQIHRAYLRSDGRGSVPRHLHPADFPQPALLDQADPGHGLEQLIRFNRNIFGGGLPLPTR